MVFVASILVPTFKLVGIALLLYSVQRHQPMSARQRHPDVSLHRMDRALVDARYLRHRRPGAGEFGNLASIGGQPRRRRLQRVVVLTMLAAVTFDPPLIWDNTRSG